MNKNLMQGIGIGAGVALIIGGILFQFFQKNEFEVKDAQDQDVSELTTEISASKSNDVPIPISIEVIEMIDVFSASPRPSNISNVVGYLASGAFVMYVPDWFVEHWKAVSDKDGNSTIFSPRDFYGPRDFSDITITMRGSSEGFNAEYLYDNDRNDPVMTAPITAEVFFNESGDTLIYHLQRVSNGRVFDVFYLNGLNKTAIINFSSNRENASRYGQKVKEFVRGIGKGGQPQG